MGEVEVSDLTIEKLKEIKNKYNTDLTADRRNDEQDLINKVKGNPTSGTVAVLSVEAADPRKVNQIALQKVDQSLNVLRFYIPSFRGIIYGEELKEIKRTIIVSSLTERKVYNSKELCNPVDPLVSDEIINQDLIMALEHKDFRLINNLLLKQSGLSPLEDGILTAIYWIGNAAKNTNPTDKLIKYVIGLDSLLAQGRADKSETVAKRFTVIMYANSSDAEIVKRYCEIKNYYTLRNNIMHAGSKYIDEKIQDWVSNLTYNLLFYIQRYNSVTELQEKLFPIREDILHNADCQPYNL